MKKILLVLVIFAMSLTQVKADSLEEVGDDVFTKKVLEIMMKYPDVIQASMTNYQNKLRKEKEEAEFRSALENRVEVDYGKSPTVGNKKAKFQLVVFTDFQCPYCKRGDANIRKMKEMLGDDLYVVYKNYPLAFHKQAKPAALHALAAHKQGKFEEYSQALFDSSKQFQESTYIEIAESLKLNIDKFKKDAASQEVKNLLQADIDAAGEIGVQSTPSFFLNGVKVSGAYPVSHFEKIMAALESQEK